MSVTSGMPLKAIRPGEGEMGQYVGRLNSVGGTVFSVPHLGEEVVVSANDDGQLINMGRLIMGMVYAKVKDGEESTIGRRIGIATHRMKTLDKVLDNIYLADGVASIRT